MTALEAAIQPHHWHAGLMSISLLKIILLDGRVKPGHMEKGHAGRAIL
jgi:hypothetical protein